MTCPMTATDLRAIRSALRLARSSLVLGDLVTTDDGAAASVTLLTRGARECRAIIGYDAGSYHAMDAAGRALGEGKLEDVVRAAVAA